MIYNTSIKKNKCLLHLHYNNKIDLLIILLLYTKRNIFNKAIKLIKYVTFSNTSNFISHIDVCFLLLN